VNEKMPEELSNRALAVLLVLTIVVSIGGTLISLNSMPKGIAGYVSTAQGTTELTISALTEITLTDDAVNFGTCGLNSSQTITYQSNASDGESQEDSDSTCTGTFPDYMVLENTGNKYVNLTISSNVTGATFVNASSGEGSLYFSASNKDPSSCLDGLVTTFTNFTLAANNYTLCNNFSPTNTEDELYLMYQVTLPPDTRDGTKTAQITIVGEDSLQ